MDVKNSIIEILGQLENPKSITVPVKTYFQSEKFLVQLGKSLGIKVLIYQGFTFQYQKVAKGPFQSAAITVIFIKR